MLERLFMTFLRHRIGITYEAEAENVTSVDIINKIVNEIEVP
jgi:MoxR-like ATPase